MSAGRVLAAALAAGVGVGACSGERLSPDGSDGAAVGVCRSSLEGVSDRERLATTVRPEGDGYVVSAWTDGQARGVPDYVCVVERDSRADRGVAVMTVRPSPPGG